jgi:hypothetical protein
LEDDNDHLSPLRIEKTIIMENNTTSLFWKLFCALAFWTLVLSVVQSFGLYYLITRFTAIKLNIQADTIDKQTDKLVAEMKNFPSLEEVKVLGDNIDKVEREMGGKIEAMERDILKDLSPTLRIKSQKPYFVSGNQIKYLYSIENKGKYGANINNVKLQLSTTKIESPNNIKNTLILNKDYALKSTSNIEDISPGEEIKHDFTIDFLNSRKVPETIYYCVTFDAQTDPNIIKSVKNIDKEKIINKKPYYILGDITTPG